MKRISGVITFLVLLFCLCSCSEPQTALITPQSCELSLEITAYDSNSAACCYKYVATNNSEFKVTNISINCVLIDANGIILGTTNASINATIGVGETAIVEGSFPVNEFASATVLKIDSISCKNEDGELIESIIDETAIDCDVVDLESVHNTIRKQQYQYQSVVERLNVIFKEYSYRTLNPGTVSSKIDNHEIRHYMNDWVEVIIELDKNDTYVSGVGVLFRTADQTSGWQNTVFEVLERLIPAVFPEATEYDAEDAVTHYENIIRDGYNYNWPAYNSEDSHYYADTISCSIHIALGNIVVRMYLE